MGKGRYQDSFPNEVCVQEGGVGSGDGRMGGGKVFLTQGAERRGLGEPEKPNEYQCSWISAAMIKEEMKPETWAIVRSRKALSFLIQGAVGGHCRAENGVCMLKSSLSNRASRRVWGRGEGCRPSG